VPALGFFDVYPMRYSFVADHFQYLASAVLIALAASVGASALRSLAPGQGWPGRVAGGVVLGLLGVLTWQQGYAYENLQTLWTDTLRKNPDCWMAEYNLGRLQLNRGEIGPAVEHFSRALAIKPDLAEAHSAWGEALAGQGRLDEAVQRFAAAAVLQPDRADNQLNLGVTLARQGKLAEADRHFVAALQVNPRYAEAHYSLGASLEQQGKLDEAAAAYREAVGLRPDAAPYHHSLADVLQRLGKTADAEEERSTARWLEQGGRTRAGP
jgi:tetratricopeptide (TPR) repeat protein